MVTSIMTLDRGMPIVRLIFVLVFFYLLLAKDAASQNFWQATNGPTGGTVETLSINSSETIFAGTNNGGVFRTMDNGSTWTQVNSGLTSLDVEALAINAGGVIFAGTDGGGAFRSLNNGDNWASINLGLTVTRVLALAINASGHIFAGTENGGVFRSVNSGDSWIQINTGLTNLRLRSLAIYSNGDIYAGTLGGVFRSTNNGDSWIQVNNGLPSTTIKALAVNASGHIFAGTDGSGAFRSTNNGTSWTQVNNGLTNLLVYAFAINSEGHIFAGTLGGGVFSSEDNGDSWKLVNAGLTQADVEVLAIDSNGFIYAGTGTGTVFRSTQPTTTSAGFCETFDDRNDDGWIRLTSTSWTVSQDEIAIAYFLSNAGFPLATGLLGEYSIFNGFSGRDFDFNCRARSAEDVSSAARPDIAIIYEYVDEMNYSYAMYNKEAISTNISKIVNGVRTKLADGSSVPVVRDELYHAFRVLRTGSQVEVYYDGMLVMSAIDPNPISGKFGVGSLNDRAYFDEANVNLFCPARSDLDVTNVSSPVSATAGLSLSVTNSVKNQENVSAATFRVGIYLSSDTVIGLSDFPLGNRNVTSLAGGTTSTDNTSVTIPAGIAAGNYYIGVYADDRGQVSEEDENNNTDSVPITILTNQFPVVVNPIPNQTLTVSGASFTRNLNVTPVVFSDPDGDALNYTSSSSAPVVATTNILGSVLTVSPVSGGTATITVTANDGRGGTAQTSFTVTVNRPPTVANVIPTQALTVGGSAFTRNLNSTPAVFIDPDGDALSYAASSSATNIATASISGNMLTVAPVSGGSATITVTANDGRGGTAQTSFTVTVNRPPTVANVIPTQALTVGGSAFTRNLNSTPAVFSDPDGDPLTYSANSSLPSIATAAISGSTLTITPVAAGNAVITVTANDGKGGMDSTMFTVTVAPPGSTPSVTTNAATNVATTSATLNGTVNANGSSTTVRFEYGTTTSYGSMVTATQSPVTGMNSTSVSATITSLSPNTLYHYRVVATNSVGTTNGADQTFTTLPSGSAPTTTTNSPTGLSSSSATLNGTVNPNGLSTTVTFQYGTTTSYGNQVTATQSPVTGTNPVSISASITSLSPGTTYHYRVVATNSAGTTNGNDQMFTTYPTSFPVSTTVNFPSRANASDYQATDYRIIGLPGASNQLVNSFLTGTQNRDWQVYWDNGAASNFFVAFDGSSTFQFTAGRAFWIINKGSLSINTTAPAAPLNVNQQIEISLQTGWNLISNPFTSSVAWSRVQSANGNITELIWAFNGSFSQSANIDPYVGYYFFNVTNLSKLVIPYSIYFSSSSVPQEVDPASWRVKIELSSPGFLDENWLGISNAASRELDALDHRKPRTVSAVPTVSFHRPEWDADFSTFATDIRPEFNQTESWDFEVRGGQRQICQLTLDGVKNIPEQFEVYLSDESRGKYVNAREQSSYEFMAVGEVSKFRVVVGKQESVQEDLNAVHPPTEFALGKNYPNPFNPSTMIPLAIPLHTEIDLRVYNLLGQEVKTIYTGAIEAGRYDLSWDGRDDAGQALSSGIYLYRLTTLAGVNLTGRMVLLK